MNDAKLEFLIVKAQDMNFCQQFEMNRMNRNPIIGYVVLLGLRKPRQVNVYKYCTLIVGIEQD